MSDHTTTTERSALRLAAPVHAPSAASALADAFQDDPVFGYCIPDGSRRRRVLPEFFRLLADVLVPYGTSMVADGPDGGVVGAALWVPPGEPPVPAASADAFEAGLAELLEADAERTFEIVALLDEHHPHDAHHYLWFLGVRSAWQGRGIGTSLMSPVLGIADEGAVAAYLEATSEHNRRLYERHGFVTVAELSVPGSPTLWAMRREPSAA